MSQPIHQLNSDLHRLLTEALEAKCEAGKVPGAWKGPDGEWWVPDAFSRDLGLKAAELVSPTPGPMDFLFDCPEGAPEGAPEVRPPARPWHKGDTVTTVAIPDPPTDWTPEALRSRRFGVAGTIVDEHNSHGLCYEVQHLDGSIGYYDPRELRPR